MNSWEIIMLGQKKDIYGNPIANSSRRKLIIVIGVLGVLVGSIVLILMALGGSKKASTQKTITTNSFSNSQFSVRYPEGFTVSDGTDSSPFATFSSADEESAEEIIVSRYGRRDGVDLNKLRDLASIDKQATTEEREVSGNKVLVVARTTEQDNGSSVVRKQYYVYAAIYVWSLEINANENSNLDKNADSILESFKPQDADILKSLNGDPAKD